MIRPLIEDDAEELTALLIANRDGFAAVMPDRPEAYYTVEFHAAGSASTTPRRRG